MNTTQTRIVVIEDQMMLRDLFTSMAQCIPGISVVGEALDGREGLELCEDEKTELAIYDLFLPSLNGIEILRLFGIKIQKLGSSPFQPISQRIRSARSWN